MNRWIKSGAPWVWLNAAAVSTSIVLVCGLLLLIAIRGLGHFWPADVTEFSYVDKNNQQVRIIGEVTDEETVPLRRLQDAGITLAEGRLDASAQRVQRLLVKTGNRDVLGLDFQWLLVPNIDKQSTPEALVTVERYEWGNFYGYLKSVKADGKVIDAKEALWAELEQQLDRAAELHSQIRKIEKDDIGTINYQLERLRLRQKKLELQGDWNTQNQQELAQEKQQAEAEYGHLQKALNKLYSDINRDSITMETASGQAVDIPLAKVVNVYKANEMSVLSKIGFYIHKVWEFLTDDPREANTEGGIFPAIFGTVLMVIIMSIIVTPFGVIAAVYLREYATQGFLTRLIRIAVNNLAGVPSIVYGVFGLGFFVYFLGGNLDRLFFPEALPAPTFGTPGIMWASLTLALLTLPVVIVATEEGLSRIPKSIREGSLALGATKAETLWRTVLPMASPAMMTGLILAVARAAGEVAPLMLVGVVKLAPSLALDANAPFLHLDRKFMHLGFHIYDVGFQSPNVEAARPLVYATALLLVVVIVVLNMAAVAVRNQLREKYRALEG
ncbi:MAG: phosphate ABC transporter permease PstA [Gammaproteobacteria bacterium]|nr:phosphate ABC transporter permease PstA [Gammaproteobacteria bacterium]MDH5800873.1 phosphate ABC transporter permease PstA [Gammaproteobacteria bacterium]